jgi:hypothetical protein
LFTVLDNDSKPWLSASHRITVETVTHSVPVASGFLLSLLSLQLNLSTKSRIDTRCLTLYYKIGFELRELA